MVNPGNEQPQFCVARNSVTGILSVNADFVNHPFVVLCIMIASRKASAMTPQNLAIIVVIAVLVVVAIFYSRKR